MSGEGALPLNAVELRVLEGRANGLTYMQLASRLNYTYSSTVNVGFRVIKKLGARDMAHAVFVACQLKLLAPNRRHGDHAGFAAHRYRGEEPCDDCWAGERAYRAEQRQRRRQEATDGPQGAPEAANGARDVRGAAGAAERRTAARGEAAA